MLAGPWHGGADHAVHGLRSSFRDWAAEKTDVADAVAEACLAHAVGDKTKAAYLRTDFFRKRARLMQNGQTIACRRPGRQPFTRRRYLAVPCSARRSAWWARRGPCRCCGGDRCDDDHSEGLAASDRRKSMAKDRAAEPKLPPGMASGERLAIRVPEAAALPRGCYGLGRLNRFKGLDGSPPQALSVRRV